MSKALWAPTDDFIKNTHIFQWMQQLNFKNFNDFHEFSVSKPELFWPEVLKRLAISFKTPWKQVLDLSQGLENPLWFTGSQLNIAQSCFNAPHSKIAIHYQSNPESPLQSMTYGALQALTFQVANGLRKKGLAPHDRIALIMPLTINAIAIYLGILSMGGTVVAIADSFSSAEIKTRLNITTPKLLFTQDYFVKNHKKINLYEKIRESHPPPCIVISSDQDFSNQSRKEDISWNNFLSDLSDLSEKKEFYFEPMSPNSQTTILFSSGTTGVPKAIPWTQLTPIKAASDAYFHQDVHSEDILTWPTSLGWMMGPWLVFSALINQATLAIFEDYPGVREFGEFVTKNKVTILGVVPTLVAKWRQSRCMENLDWSHIKCFTSTAECSNPFDMQYLSQLAHGKPIIEYCGGTEVVSYISSTLIEPNYPSTFTTATMGSKFMIIDEKGQESSEGEVALFPAALGSSSELLNGDHHEIYFKNMPLTPSGLPLRRHGDLIKKLAEGQFILLGRTDDTMKLSGIKISAHEIEEALGVIPGILETAAVAYSDKNGGPSQLIIFAATQATFDLISLKKIMQAQINQKLNPLFKISEVILLPELPKTASNKILRRLLREKNGYRGQAAVRRR